VGDARCKPPGFEEEPTVRWGVHSRASQIALERTQHLVTGQQAGADRRSYEAQCARRPRKLPAE